MKRWRCAHQYQGDMLHSGRVKIFMDGVLESMTALMLDDYPGFPGERGAPLFTAEAIQRSRHPRRQARAADQRSRHRRWRRAPHP